MPSSLVQQESQRLITRVPTAIRRPLLQQIAWTDRLIGLRGARGVGKTTLLLQHGKEEAARVGLGNVLYISLDDLLFRQQTLIDFAREFRDQGGQVLLLDEVHRYPDWSVELKLIYDKFDDLLIRFTSSSIIELSHAKGDLSRRAVMYDMYGLSFREYLIWRDYLPTDIAVPHTLSEIITRHQDIAWSITKNGLEPQRLLLEYWKDGYYPYRPASPEVYLRQVADAATTVIDTDLPPIFSLTPATTEKIKRLLVTIAENVPYKPNISKLAQQLEISRPTVQNYLFYLHQARLIGLLPSELRGIIRTQKPEKVYLDNPTLLYAMPNRPPNTGNLRETYFYSALSTAGLALAYSTVGDFKTDEYVFEVGGPNKKNTQLQSLPNGYRALDGIGVGFGNAIPLWLFGFLR